MKGGAHLLWLLVPLLLLAGMSLMVGTRSFTAGEVLHALSGGGGRAADTVLSLRVPRTLLAILVGLGLGVSGALMQTLTRNPIADPGLLGVNAGAGLAVVLGVVLIGTGDPHVLVILAFAGAMAAAVGVQVLGSRGGATPIRLTLAGLALSALLGGITTSILLRDAELLRQTLGWGAGSLVVTGTAILFVVAPVIVAASLLALLLGTALDGIALGEDVAQALGINVARTRILALLALAALAGAATAAAGPVAFVGLMVPHAVRLIAGPHVRITLAGCALFGPTLLLAADIIARVLLSEGEVPLGLVTSAIGAPLLILLARRSKRLAP